ncbi:MAG: hypothetical protein QOC78_1366 [Solirubrobacteraceae bacterium]|nr:hypothetical protein [Solirubrobacteraceae bacterium]
MFTTIIAGVDGLSGGLDALALADLLRRAGGGDVAAVTAYPVEPMPSRAANPAYVAVIEDEARTVVERELAQSGIEARVVAMGDVSPGRALHEIAEREDADVIVVGSPHRGPMGRILLGDIAAGTLHGAPCAVAVAPQGFASVPRELRTIGVGYDGSPEALAAVRLAGELARGCGAGVQVVTVLRRPTYGAPFPMPGMDPYEEAATRHAAAQALVDEAVAELGDIAHGEVVSGEAARELAEATRNVDLMVVGSRGYGPVRRVMLGSTSTRLVHDALCPVLVLPRLAARRSETSADAEAAAPVS